MESGAGLKVVKEALELYGSTLLEGGHIKSNKTDGATGIRAVVQRKRLRFESASGQLFASGPISRDSVCGFVEKFWFWKKISNPA